MQNPFAKKFIQLTAFLCLLTTSAFGGSVLIVNGTSSEPATLAAITTNVQALQEAAGNTVTVVDTAPLNLSSYSQVWDIRFDTALTPSEQSRYLTFLSGGGGMVLAGENGFADVFAVRNDSLLAFIAAAGGGTLEFVQPDDTQSILAPFTGPSGPISSLTYATPGGVDSKGSGEWITKSDGLEQGSGVAFSAGDLTNAPAGALAVMFDVNFMQQAYDLPNSQYLTENLIRFVTDQVASPSAPGVPDGASTALLTGLALLALITGRRFRRVMRGRSCAPYPPAVLSFVRASEKLR